MTDAFKTNFCLLISRLKGLKLQNSYKFAFRTFVNSHTDTFGKSLAIVYVRKFDVWPKGNKQTHFLISDDLRFYAIEGNLKGTKIHFNRMLLLLLLLWCCCCWIIGVKEFIFSVQNQGDTLPTTLKVDPQETRKKQHICKNSLSFF